MSKTFQERSFITNQLNDFQENQTTTSERLLFPKLWKKFARKSGVSRGSYRGVNRRSRAPRANFELPQWQIKTRIIYNRVIFSRKVRSFFSHELQVLRREIKLFNKTRIIKLRARTLNRDLSLKFFRRILTICHLYRSQQRLLINVVIPII